MVPTRHIFRWLFPFLILGLPLAGCAKSTLTVDALSAPASAGPANLRYTILPGMA